MLWIIVGIILTLPIIRPRDFWKVPQATTTSDDRLFCGTYIAGLRRLPPPPTIIVALISTSIVVQGGKEVVSEAGNSY